MTVVKTLGDTMLRVYNKSTNDVTAQLDALQAYTRQLTLVKSQQEYLEDLYRKIAVTSALAEAAIEAYLETKGVTLEDFVEE